MEDVTRLYLVACAQTTLDSKGVFQGPADHRLSRKGTSHAKLLRMHLKDHQIDSFYSSPYGGAFATASAIAAGHRRGVIRLRDLREMDFGQWVGRSPNQLKESDPDGLIAWQFTPHEYRMPGGETLAEVQSRVVSALEDVVSVEEGNVVCVVTHSIPLKTAMSHFLNEDLSIIWFTPRQESTALNIIAFQGDQATVTLVDSLEHLGKDRPT
jgi:broad specificity phosphatase PhoE